jgi:hypothetical protein
MSLRVALPLSLGLLVGCNVTAASTTGGADLPSRGACPRGLAVVSSDYLSSEIALLTPEADIASAAFLSSASTRTSGLAAPISGDVGAASARRGAGELVVVDRFGTDVLSFVDTKTAEVRAQLPIGTDFEANPQDYLEIDQHLAFVPRLGENRSPGREPFDRGSDVLVIDPSVPEITGAVAMPRKQGYLPNPSEISRFGDDVLVTLVHSNPDFSAMADSELVALSVKDAEVRYQLPLAGLKNCGRAELSPSASRLALACSGFIDRQGNVPEPEASGLVLLDATTDPPSEVQRFSALELLQQPLQGSVEFVDERRVLIKTQTAIGGGQDNALYVLELETGATQRLAQAGRNAAGAGYGIALGGMHCDHDCGPLCLVADASRGQLLRFSVGARDVKPTEPLRTGGAGLPPIGITPLF